MVVYPAPSRCLLNIGWRNRQGHAHPRAGGRCWLEAQMSFWCNILSCAGRWEEESRLLHLGHVWAAAGRARRSNRPLFVWLFSYFCVDLLTAVYCWRVSYFSRPTTPLPLGKGTCLPCHPQLHLAWPGSSDSVSAEWLLGLISCRGEWRSIFFSRFPLRLGSSCWWMFLFQWIDFPVGTLWKGRVGSESACFLSSRECFLRRTFHQPAKKVSGPSRSSLFHTSLPFLRLPLPFKALVTGIWKQATGPFKIIHINMRPTQFFINRSSCFCKVGFQKHSLL